MDIVSNAAAAGNANVATGITSMEPNNANEQIHNRNVSATDERQQRTEPSTRNRSRRQQPISVQNESDHPQGNYITYEEEEEELELKYGAQHVIKLFIPVSLCMAVVVATVSSITFYTKTDLYLLYTPFHEESDLLTDKIYDAFLNSMILLSVVITLTIILIFLYKQRCYMIIKVWLGLSSVLLLSFFSALYLMEVLRGYNIGLDWITLTIIVWNFGAVGLVSIHWKGPLKMQQAYLIFISSLMSLIFIKYLPPITLWFVLAIISLWDLVAVLCPKGPLRILVETAQERNESIFPALIYSSNIMYSAVSDGEVDAPARMSGRRLNSPENNSTAADRPVDGAADDQRAPEQENNGAKRRRKRKRDVNTESENGRVSDGAAEGFTDDWEDGADERSRRRRERIRDHLAENPNSAPLEMRLTGETVTVIEEDERGVKLGLGDFIFYSVLVGKASSYGDWNTTFACFISILIGLCLTLIMLAIFKKALPALPISIAFGLTFYFSTSLLVVPFTEELTIQQVFI